MVNVTGGLETNTFTRIDRFSTMCCIYVFILLYSGRGGMVSSSFQSSYYQPFIFNEVLLPCCAAYVDDDDGWGEIRPGLPVVVVKYARDEKGPLQSEYQRRCVLRGWTEQTCESECHKNNHQSNNYYCSLLRHD